MSQVEVALECTILEGSTQSLALFLIYVYGLLHSLAQLGQVRSQAFTNDSIIRIARDVHVGNRDSSL